MNLQLLQNSAHRNCVEERDLHGLTKLADFQAVLMVQWQFQYLPSSTRCNKAKVTIAGTIYVIYNGMLCRLHLPLCCVWDLLISVTLLAG